MSKIDDAIERIGMEQMNSRDTPKIMPWVMQEMPNGESCLAVGCGDSKEVEMLWDKYKIAFGVDKNPENRDPEELRVTEGDMHDLPFPEGHFDIVLSKDSFEHATAPEVALKEMARVAKKAVVIVLPDDVWTEHEWHTIIPNMRQMMWLAEKAGLKLAKFRELRTVISGSYLLWYHLYVFSK